MSTPSKPLPSKEYLDDLFSYDPDTGQFTRRVRRGRWWAGTVAGYASPHGGWPYVYISIDGALYSAHRLAFVIMGAECPLCVDHIDGNGLNNKWANLRPATLRSNQWNMRVRKDNTSGVKNVHWDKKIKRWTVMIMADGVRICRCFEDLDEAEEYAKTTRDDLHGDFARAS